TDGVVIGYQYFGSTGVVEAPYDLGRTTTHEIGHWLNLEHIWGDDDNCSGSDNVSDTPNQETETTGCPSGVRTDNCTSNSPGVMYQNYMDYTDDACMVMFTKGQVDRMNAVFDIARSAIKTSNKCSGTTGVSLLANNKLKIYPNPVQNYLTIEGLPKTRSGNFNIDIFNALGQKVYTTEISSDTMIEMTDLKTGTYVMTIYNNDFTLTQKLTVLK
ncbi:MAG TPA: zinc-dependent metalloprotease, partial [Chitinophagales bacterium]|nr:zinc-dependent metalloprotease [Chitinophagales bacterium]